ncbi:MAG: tetratricopeptide repeat protein [Planctomycetaceae bacterium]|nr:tetratricopeptide repeat protein [Planctomycetaceae bacterium]
MLRTTGAMALLFVTVLASGQDSEPTPARTKADQPRGEKIDAATAAKILTETYERTKDAQSPDDFGQVIEVCERALAADPPEKIRKYAHQLAAWAFNRRGEVYADQAADLFNRGAQRQANELDALALDDFHAAVAHDPAKWKAIHNRGVSLALHGKVEEALADFDQVLKLNPQFANSRFNRAEIRAQQGKWQAAIEDYNEVLKAKADDVGALLGRGNSLVRAGQLAEALADVELALRYSPESAAAFAGRGDVHCAAGRWNQAGEDYREAIKLDAKLGRAYRGVAWLLATCPDEHFRDRDLALASAEKAIALDGESDWTYLDALAAAQANAGRYGQAQATLEKAIQIAPDSVDEALQSRLARYRDRQPHRLQ